MIIIALTTNGVLIEATEEETKEILRSVTGDKVKELNIGQKIPAIDYAASITKVKNLSEVYEYKKIFERLAEFNKIAQELKEAVDNASNIDI